MRIRGAGHGGPVRGLRHPGFRQSEIKDLGVSALGHEQVRRLDVPMNNPFGVRGIQCVGDLDSQVEQRFQFHGLGTDTMFQGYAIEKFHGDEDLAVLVADVVDGADVGMVERGRGLRFALKTSQHLGIASDLVGEEFQGDEAVKASVLGFVDDSHAAAPKLLGNAIVRDGLTNHSGDGWLRGRLILRMRVRRVNE